MEKLEALAKEAEEHLNSRKGQSRWPASLKECVLELRKAGYSASVISQKTRISVALIYRWSKAEQSKSSFKEIQFKDSNLILHCPRGNSIEGLSMGQLKSLLAEGVL